MAEVQIRNAVATDIPVVMGFDHSSKSDYVWQFDLQLGEDQVGAIFREIRLPRSITIRYPKSITSLPDYWNRQSEMIVAVVEKGVCGYLRVTDFAIAETSWITDLVVAQGYRRKGIGRSLLLAAQNWAMERQKSQIIVEMSAKNHPAINLVKKMGYEFCGYNDNYYSSNDVALFFGRPLRAKYA
jgi:ribosomal protein S18 acetylase RimI-like enzyme